MDLPNLLDISDGTRLLGVPIAHLFSAHDTNDTVSNYHDLSMMLDLVEQNPNFPWIDKTRLATLKSEMIYILWQSKEKRAILNQLHDAKLDALNSTLRENWKWGELVFYNYTKIVQLMEIMGGNLAPIFVKKFLENTEIIINKYLFLQEPWRKIKGWRPPNSEAFRPKINIEEEYEKYIQNEPSQQWFMALLNQVRDIYGDPWEIILLELFVKKSEKNNIKILEYVIFYLQQVTTLTFGIGLNKTDQDTLELRKQNYLNILTLATTKKRIIEYSESMWTHQWHCIVLSWGVLNGIAQIWVIRQIIEKWDKITCLTGYSIGATIASILAFALNWNQKHDLQVIDEIQKYIIGWIIKEEKGVKEWIYLAWNLHEEKWREKIMDFFKVLWEKFWINDHTTFEQSNIPLIIWASREYGKGVLHGDTWEQSILVSGKENVRNWVIASNNLMWLFWKKIINWASVADYAENQSGVPVIIAQQLWFSAERQIVIDAGFSSLKFNTVWSTWLSRSYWAWGFWSASGWDSTSRDMLRPFWVHKGWWRVYHIDCANINPNWIIDTTGENIIWNLNGFYISASIAWELLSRWRKTMSWISAAKYHAFELRIMGGENPVITF